MPVTVRRPFTWAEALEPRRLLAGQFFPGEEMAVGASPSAAVVADFNADGRLDAAVTNAASDSVTVALGDGRGGLALNATYATPPGGSAPKNVVRADFNADGKIDLAVANSASPFVTLLIGVGDGTFTTAGVNAGPHLAIHCGDYDNDGRSDLATADFTSSATVRVRLNTGGLTFGPPVASFAAGAFPEHLAGGDFNGDGRTDLVADGGGNTITVALNAGDGTFATPITRTVGTSPVEPVVGDFNGDAKADIAVANRGQSTVSVLLGSGFGTFTNAANATVAPGPAALASLDFNGDGKSDLVSVSPSSGQITRLAGNGNGTFAVASVPLPRTATDVAAGDFNGDGKGDVLAVYAAAGRVSALLTGYAQPLDLPVRVPAGAGPTGVLAADVNGDGTPDLVTADTAGNTITVVTGNRDGTFAAPVARAVGPAPRAVVAADLDGDGDVDLAVANSGNNTVSVLTAFGNIGFNAAVTVNCGAGPVDLAAIDLNGDGRVDLVTADAAGDSVTRLINDGTGLAFAATAFSLGAGTQPAAVVVGRFNADAYPDVAVAGRGTHAVRLLAGGPAGGLSPLATLASGNGPADLVTTDLDGDGTADLITADAVGRSITVLRGQTGGGYSTTTIPVDTEASALALADVDGDGRLDLSVAGSDDGTVQVMTGTAGGGFVAAHPNRVYVGTPRGVAAGDFDADGRSDLAVTDEANGRAVVLLNRQRVTSPFVTIANDEVTVAGTGQTPVTLTSNGDRLTIGTPAGDVNLTTAALHDFVLSGVNATLAGDLRQPNGSGIVRLTVKNNAQATSTSRQHLFGLTLGDTGTFRLAPGGNLLLRTRQLSAAAGARLDLSDNAMAYDAGVAVQNATTQTRLLLAGGRAGGLWTGPGLTSSAAASRPGRDTALNFMTVTQYQQIYGGNAFFAGEALGDAAVLIRYTTVGDTDFSGRTTFDDFVRVQTNFGSVGTSADGDFDLNGRIDFDDFVLLQTAYGAAV